MALAAAGCSSHAAAGSPAGDAGPAVEGGAFLDADAGDSGTISPRRVALAAGATHTCAILASGAVRCWGDNTNGQLGRPEPGDPLSDSFVDLGAGQLAKGLAAGANHTCVILDDGKIKCWGMNNFGQLGLEDMTTRGDGTTAMGDSLPEVNLGAGQAARALAAGAEATCAILDTGFLKCWGNDYQGALGYGDIDTRGASPGTMGDALSTVDLGSRDGVPFKVSAIAAVDYHSFCAILEDTGADNSAMKCWGSNNYCELGLGKLDSGRGATAGSMGNALEWTDIGTTSTGAVRKAIALAGGYQYMCALGSDGVVKCWGENVGGQLGIGVKGVAVSCKPGEMGNAGLVSFDSPAVAIAARGPDNGEGAHTCALLANGQVRCWGENAHGQLGTGDATDRSVPSEPLAFGMGFVPARLVAGYQHTCAISSDDRVACWGSNAEGQLGTSGSTDVLAPGPITRLGGPSVQAIGTGSDHTCAILEGGALKCWGRNADGELGTGDQMNRGDQADQLGDHLLPVDLGTGAVATQVAGGASHTCVVLSGGAVKCWGSNAAGELGQGNTTPLYAPPSSAVSLGSPVLAVSLGAEFTCTLLSNGNVECWGLNASGQLGLGDTMARSAPSPSPVALGAPAIAVAAGDQHVCALLTTGQIACWGDNTNGQLGLGAVAKQLVPSVVDLGAHTVKALAARGSETCVLLDTRQVSCWGDNASGQLGLGDVVARSTPAAVAIDLGTGRSASALSVGGAFACALLDTSQAKCWGDNTTNQLGTALSGMAIGVGPDQLGDFLPTVFQGGGRSVKTIASGRGHTCVLLDTNDVRCWGDNTYGQLGVGDAAIHSYYFNPSGLVDLGSP